jgi:hypothetical protein
MVWILPDPLTPGRSQYTLAWVAPGMFSIFSVKLLGP